MTALAATVGTRNIAGVATAFAIGRPGALFLILLCKDLAVLLQRKHGIILATQISSLLYNKYLPQSIIKYPSSTYPINRK